jgi:hypothetical protein
LADSAPDKKQRPAASSAPRRSIPIRTFSGWQDPPPGFVEADLVAHCGQVTSGGYVQTLVLTGVASGWMECAPLLVREQKRLRAAVRERLSTLVQAGRKGTERACVSAIIVP